MNQPKVNVLKIAFIASIIIITVSTIYAIIDTFGETKKDQVVVDNGTPELDIINNYEVTVNPNMNDGSLDLIYDIEWEVLDDTTEGPLTWVRIGMPNPNYKNLFPLTPNITTINEMEDRNYIKITFDRPYLQGEVIHFKYRFTQEYVYKLSGKKCKYEFTPAWFTDCKVKIMRIKWAKDKVTKNDATTDQDNYYIWNKANLAKGEKLTAKVQYKKNAFGNLDSGKQAYSGNSNAFMIFVCILLFVVLSFGRVFMGFGGYDSHSGFYCDHYGGYHSSCAHSSCACASRCACACACAGSGRAGCSKKDFYGTNLKTEKLKKALKES